MYPQKASKAIVIAAKMKNCQGHDRKKKRNSVLKLEREKYQKSKPKKEYQSSEKKTKKRIEFKRNRRS